MVMSKTQNLLVLLLSHQGTMISCFLAAPNIPQNIWASAGWHPPTVVQSPHSLAPFCHALTNVVGHRRLMHYWGGSASTDCKALQQHTWRSHYEYRLVRFPLWAPSSNSRILQIISESSECGSHSLWAATSQIPTMSPLCNSQIHQITFSIFSSTPQVPTHFEPPSPLVRLSKSLLSVQVD